MQEPGGTAPGDRGSAGGARVSALTATAIAVADMIGIGVFTSLGFQVAGIPSAFSLVMLWVVGGITALCGALSYAELAAALPRSGGEYNFLSRIYHPAVGFLAGWISATVGFAAPIAIAAMAFGTYFLGAVPGILGGSVAPDVASLLLALALAWVISLVHLGGVRQGSLLQNISTAVKVVLIVAFIVAGFAIGTPQPVSFAPSAQDVGHILSAPFAISLVFVMYSYSGWNAATYIINEVRDPERSLPRSLLVATLVVLALYVALNAVFLYTTPMTRMAGQINVAQIAGEHIFGDTGGRLVAALICIGLVSAVSAMVWIGPRVTMVIGEDLPGLRLFARTTEAGVPAAAILLQLAVVTLLLFTQSFEAVVHYVQFSLTFCTFLAVLGVIVLRWTQPGLKRPYRVWAYPVTPAIFLLVTGYMMYFQLTQRPAQSLAGVATMLAGLLVFAVSRRPASAQDRAADRQHEMPMPAGGKPPGRQDAMASPGGGAAPKIFVNYRRDDVRDLAARIRDRLAAAFGNAHVFMDIDNLRPGQRFDKELERALAETSVFLAVIGPRWSELLAQRQSERDFVREEIGAALRRGVPVIPVLAEHTPVPNPDTLPEDIRDLVLHQVHVVTHERFGRDVEDLAQAIQSAWAGRNSAP